MPIDRRHFLGAGATLALAGAVPSVLNAAPAGGGRRDFSVDRTSIRYRVPGIARASRLMLVADTHLFRDDARGEPFRQYSARMAAAYNRTRHFQTGEATDPETELVAALGRARENRVDRVALVGDLLSFPSEAAVEWVQARLADAGVPHLYVAGNHDWHYEGMPGSLEELRSTWIYRRLLPLYDGRDPLAAACDVGEVRVLAIDNSHYEILPVQLEMLRAEVRSGRPLFLLVHIPLYVPGRPVGFGCGHPEWGSASDRNHELERRPRWPASGHTEVTLAFHREVFAAPNLLGIGAGHIHRPSIDLWQGVPQFVTEANAVGGFLDIEFLPAF